MKKDKNFVDITGVDLVKFVKKVYELSSPQGLGFLHYEDGDLSTERAKEIIGQGKTMLGDVILDMDYIKGRACKMVVWKRNGKLYTRASWYDHSDTQLKELLKLNKEREI